MLIDAAIVSLISVFFTLLLLWASFHKFSDRLQFQGILAAYRLVPTPVLPIIALAIPLFELGLGLAWLTGIQLQLVATCTAVLLGIYTSSIAINLIRGNVEIDCGCGLSSSKHKTAGYQKLSGGLVMRNGLLILLSLAVLLPSNARSLGFIDYASMAAACAVLFLVYAALNQLLANKQLIDSWRRPLIESSDSNG